MNQVYILKEELNSWIAKYFNKDLISIDDLIGAIEDMDSTIESLKEELEELEEDLQENYKPITKEEMYLG